MFTELLSTEEKILLFANAKNVIGAIGGVYVMFYSLIKIVNYFYLIHLLFLTLTDVSRIL